MNIKQAVREGMEAQGVIEGRAKREGGHTAGPWIVEEQPAGMRYSSLIVNARPNGPNDSPIHIARPVEWGNETAANARLIASAPDLLAALESIVTGGNVDCGTFWKVDAADMQRARAALARAEQAAPAQPDGKAELLAAALRSAGLMDKRGYGAGEHDLRAAIAKATGWSFERVTIEARKAAEGRV